MFLSQCIDYIEGRMAVGAFEALLENNSGLLDWLQSIVPSTKTMYIFDSSANKVIQLPYKIDAILKNCERIQVGGPKGSPEYRYIVHKEISDLIAEAFPEVHLMRDCSLKDDYDLCMDACPQFIGGVEIASANIIGAILATVPRTLSKAKRKKEAKEKILKAFHIEGNKYPRWKQSPEWPLYQGIPMKFVRTKKVNTEVSIHYFVDLESGFERTVEDAF